MILAKRIETVNAYALLEHTAACQRLFPEVGAEAIQVAGGVASFVGVDVPVTYAVGLGLDGPVTDEHVARVVEFYTRHGVVPRIDVCPLADKSLLESLRRHNFQLHWFTNVLARPLGTTDDIPLPSPEIELCEASPGEAEEWARVVNFGFADGESYTDSLRRMSLMLFHCPTSRAYLARIDGQAIGAGLLFTHQGYAALAAASVYPQYRNRGVHTALIRARLRRARELGCDLAGYFTMPGSTSQRNAEHHGFKLAYSKATMKVGA